jgi:lycopene elongase/hydratase (dihydrobisanhydrobacterioruberin-forming)
MKMLKWFIQLSRPRFWFYLFGPFIVGLAAAYNQFDFTLVEIPTIIIAGLFFLFPANLFIYGVNDLFDYETDKHNPKKKAYETLISPENRKFFIKVLSMVMIPFVAVLSYLFIRNDSYVAVWSLVLFLFFGTGYSMPPIRAKTKPFFDSFFNILYVFPGLVGYAIMINAWPSAQIIIAATAWVMAMHAFSAIPDISADKKAKISTIATVLGKNQTILFCTALYLTAALLTYSYIGYFAIISGFVYAVMMLSAYLAKTKEDLFSIYKLFPYVNMLAGAYLFFAVILA